MRLDIFLPFLRKPKRGGVVQPLPWPLRLARRVLPKRLFADPLTAKPGLIRRTLRRIGPTWLSAPVRRAAQAVCFVLFLVLFFYVCWPYDAQPAQSWPNWQPAEFDAAAGRATVRDGQTPDGGFREGTAVFVADESIHEAEQRLIGRFVIQSLADNQLVLEPAEPLAPESIDLIAFSSGPWTLHERQPAGWPSHYADQLAAKEVVPAESILVIDPLVSLSTAVAARSWVWSLVCAAAILAVCVLIPRGFCGYVCPLGTLIDLFDWSIGKRVTRLRLPADGWWVHLKYYLLLGTMIAAMFGVLISGFVAAIPVITRAFLFIFEPLQTGLFRGWHLVPPPNAGHAVSLVLFLAVLGLGFFQPRFWCKYVCPSGAVFSLGNLFRVSERKVESSCINCNKCVEICPFDAIKPDFTTRTTDCTLCQTCGGVCPTHAIKFVERWNFVELKVVNDPPTHETALGRRGFFSLAAGTAAAVVGGAGLAIGTKAWGANLHDENAWRPVRPPGSVPEREFLQMCIRCGECFKACPNNVLQPLGFEQGLEGLWTPAVKADWSGCESSCNACGQVCPTGAIRALPLEEKKVARMGLAIVNQKTCLPLANREACQLCVDECNAAGYRAIEFRQVHTQTDDAGQPLDGTGFLAPLVLSEKCVGCGLCQTRCYAINVAEKHLMTESAIIIEAGAGKEDRLLSGSYVALREQESAQRRAEQQRRAKEQGSGSYLPAFIE